MIKRFITKIIIILFFTISCIFFSACANYENNLSTVESSSSENHINVPDKVSETPETESPVIPTTKEVIDETSSEDNPDFNQEYEIDNDDYYYMFPYSNTRLLTTNDIVGKTASDLRIGRNEIYARHGRKFSSGD